SVVKVPKHARALAAFAAPRPGHYKTHRTITAYPAKSAQFVADPDDGRFRNLALQSGAELRRDAIGPPRRPKETWKP
ncbi:MAG TPA: hypothetical protein VK324_07510, partial [Tepidisphaeraceae bacterium]|nr:hypothetical protein [Tepidisphaeraceae bacterium]